VARSGEEIAAVLGAGWRARPGAERAARLFGSLFLVPYGVVVTNRRVLLVRCQAVTQRPRSVDWAAPRSAVHVLELGERRGWQQFVLAFGDTGAFGLTVYPMYRSAVQSVVGALGGPAP
jgi:hypothetical protein